MRRTLLCLTLLVGVIFTIGAVPSTAGAASCSSSMNIAPYQSPYGAHSNSQIFVGQVWSCSGVDIVETQDPQIYNPYGNNGQCCGYYNMRGDFGLTHLWLHTTPPNQQNNSTSEYWYMPDPCYPQGTTYMWMGFVNWWRIHNNAQGTWGPWHQLSTAAYYTFC